MAPIRVLIVDDHPAVRDGLSHLLSSEEDLLVVGQASDGRTCLSAATQLGPELILMDLNLPGADGLEVARRVRRQLPEVRILMISVREAGADAERARRAGVAAWISKNSSPQELLGAVRAVASIPAKPSRGRSA